MKFFLYFVTISCIPVYVQGQTLTLLAYRQADSGTNCSYALISGVDEVVFKSQVTLTPNATSGNVTFSILDNNDLTKAYFVTENQIIQGHCQNTEEISCTMIDPHTFRLTVRFTASSQYSRARIRGKLTTPDGKVIFSEDQPLPMIQDSIESHGLLSINDHLFQEGEVCDLVVNEPELLIWFTCDSSDEPCVIEFTTCDSAGHILGRQNVEYRKLYQTPSTVDVDIKFGACSLRVQPYTIKCHIRLESYDHRHTQLLILSVLITTAIIVICLLTVIFLTERNKKRGFWEMKGVFSVSEFERFQVHKSKKYENDEATDYSSLMTNKQKNDDSFKLLVEKKYRKKSNCCNKHPDHKHFVKITKLSPNHLPEAYRNKDVLNLVKLMADLTVKIYVIPSKLSGFIYQDVSTKRFVKYGTGFITELQFIVGNEKNSCRCRTCNLSGQDNKMAGKILIATSTAVISNNKEADNSEFEVSYKNELGFTLILRGNRMAMSDDIKGFCLVECETCSVEFMDYLDTKRKQCEKLMSEVNQLYQKRQSNDRLCVIVSHPHGSSKRVSFGQWTQRTKLKTQNSETYCRYEYTTPTCPGSSGAPLYIVGVSDISRRPNYLHWGSSDDGIRSSSFGMEIMTKKGTKPKVLKC